MEMGWSGSGWMDPPASYETAGKPAPKPGPVPMDLEAVRPQLDRMTQGRCMRCVELEAENARLEELLDKVAAAGRKLADEVTAIGKDLASTPEVGALGVSLELAEEDRV